MAFQKTETGPVDDFFKLALEDTNTIHEAKPQGMKQVDASVQDTTGVTGERPPLGGVGAGINTNAKWLASLELSDAIAVWELFKSRVELHPKHRLSPAQVLTLTSLRAADSETVRTGQWYFHLVTCEVAGISSQRQHPRWQVRLDQGVLSVGYRLKMAISQGAWQTLCSYTSYLKVEAHHVAYNASPSRETAPIPSNVGVGGSISHFCDEIGCCKASHLEAAYAHKDNMARQRCSGIILLHFQGVIVQEVPCSHGQRQGLDLELQLLSSCVNKLNMIELSVHTHKTMNIIRSG
ncbi:hypothetical protein VE03_06828 [Pseudogymnoascus sp. 23342-1-I1]|nr:hypothetical protein VE03_06828 [Pseudogymnoascus sp. 23342-1-I1]